MISRKDGRTIKKEDELKSSNIVREDDEYQMEIEGIKVKVELTCKFGSAIDQIRNISSVDKNQSNKDVPINYFLKRHCIKSSQLKMVMIYLKRKNIYLENQIGHGGEADVYLGYLVNKEGKNKEFVFRIISSSENNPQIREEYERVIEIHEPRNLVQYEGLVKINYKMCSIFIFIMKKYEGSLYDRMVKNPQMDNKEFLGIIVDLFYGLMELRINNIIHSDIKPRNVLVDKNNNCYYSDFGLAIKLTNKDESTQKKRGYTDGYNSPEHSGGQPLSYASDIFSLGQLLIDLSKILIDKEFRNQIEQFATNKMKQNSPASRIHIEDLFLEFYQILPKKDLFDQLSHIFFSKRKESISSLNFFEDILDVKGNAYKSLLLKRYYLDMKKTVLSEVLKLKNWENINCIEVAMMSIESAQIDAFDNNEEQKIKLQFANEILEKIQDNSDTKIVLMAILEKKQGDYYKNKKEYSKALQLYQVAKSHLLTSRESNYQNLKAEISQQIAICYSSQGLLDKSISLLLEGIAQIQESSKIQHFKLLLVLGDIYSKKKDIPQAKKCYEQIVDEWRKDSTEYKKASDVIKLHFLSILGYSQFKLGNYYESYQFQLQVLSFTFDEFSISQNSNLVKIINRLSIQQKAKALKELQKDGEINLMRKMVLLDFAESCLSQRNVVMTKQLLEQFNSINEQIPFQKQVQEKIILAQFHAISNLQESSKFLKQAIELFGMLDLAEDDKMKELQLSFIILIVDQFENKQQDIEFNPIFKDQMYQKSRKYFMQKKQEYDVLYSDEQFQNLIIASSELFKIVLNLMNEIYKINNEQNKINKIHQNYINSLKKYTLNI